jgi:hypothetical protein
MSGQHKPTQKYSQSTLILAIKNVTSSLVPPFLMRTFLVSTKLLIVQLTHARALMMQQPSIGLEGGCRENHITVKYCLIFPSMYYKFITIIVMQMKGGNIVNLKLCRVRTNLKGLEYP